MERGKVTPARLRNLRWLDGLIQHHEHELYHGDMVCDESVREWATLAREYVPADQFHAAMRAIDQTRQRLRKSINEDTLERDYLMAWIEAIPNEDARAAIYLHYVKGYKWQDIVDQYFGGTMSQAGVRKMCKRYIDGQHQGRRGGYRPRVKAPSK